MQRAGGRHVRPVLVRHPLVLAEVPQPRLDQEHLDEPLRVFGVLEQVPADRPVAQAGRAERPDRR